jgi:hypothetical protein
MTVENIRGLLFLLGSIAIIALAQAARAQGLLP